MENPLWDTMFAPRWNNTDAGILCDAILAPSAITFVIDIPGVNAGDLQVCNYASESAFH